MDIPGDPAAHLADAEGGGGLGADALPDEATICSCYNVTKGDLVTRLQTAPPLLVN